ncbi:MAG: hypothetical protein ACI4EA_08150 [Candidatus Ornithomonoglobus sp.]
MGRGKKTPPETIYSIMATQAVTGNARETARQLGLPPTTVRNIVNKCENDPEFVQLGAKKREEFSERAGRVIDKILDAIETKVDTCKDELPLNQLATTLGILSDKKALAEGKPTTTVSITDNADVDKLAELAGYRIDDSEQT